MRAHDPAVARLSGDLDSAVTLCESPQSALAGADVAVIATEWPAFRALRPDQIAALMRRPQVIDPNHFLAADLAADPRILYCATGRTAGRGPSRPLAA